MAAVGVLSATEIAVGQRTDAALAERGVPLLPPGGSDQDAVHVVSCAARTYECGHCRQRFPASTALHQHAQSECAGWHCEVCGHHTLKGLTSAQKQECECRHIAADSARRAVRSWRSVYTPSRWKRRCASRWRPSDGRLPTWAGRSSRRCAPTLSPARLTSCRTRRSRSSRWMRCSAPPLCRRAGWRMRRSQVSRADRDAGHTAKVHALRCPRHQLLSRADPPARRSSALSAPVVRCTLWTRARYSPFILAFGCYRNALGVAALARACSQRSFELFCSF